MVGGISSTGKTWGGGGSEKNIEPCRILRVCIYLSNVWLIMLPPIVGHRCDGGGGKDVQREIKDVSEESRCSGTPLARPQSFAPTHFFFADTGVTLG